MNDQVTENDDLTMDDIESLSELVRLESAKKEMSHQATELQGKQKELMAVVDGSEEDKDRIEEMLKDYTVEQLEIKLKDDKFVESFFTDVEGNPIKMAIEFETPGREIEFKRGLLTYFKSTQATFDKIDLEYEKLDEATKEMNENVGQALNSLSDNVLAYIDMMTDKAKAMSNEKNKKALLETIRYIRSGYDLDIYKEVLTKYPTVAKRCVSELSMERDIKKIGLRYTSKLKTNSVRVSLIDFASDIETNKKSFEEIMLIRDDQYIVPDLFIYSLIRFYAMADWNNKNIRKGHASICLTLKKLTNDEFVDEVKEKVIGSIVDYLKMLEV